MSTLFNSDMIIEDEIMIPGQTDTEMHHNADELPEPTSVLQMLLDASTEPNTRRKRASSCPPTIADFDMNEVVADLKHLQVTEPKTDPVVPMEQDANEITPENAQTLLDPSACLFVANLPIHISDDEIKMALTQYMAQGDGVYVKVNRMRDGMPFAHVQYLDADTAKEVLETKNRQLLWNRQLRIEPASATRFLFVGHRDSSRGLPTESEIRVLFEDFAIESVRLPTEVEARESRAGRSVIVNFAKWGECGEALRLRRENATFWMKTPRKSHLAKPQVQWFPAIVQHGQLPIPLNTMPLLDYSGTFTSMLPHFPPSPPPSSSPPRSPQHSPMKGIGRKRKGHQLDHLPRPHFKPRYDRGW